MKYIDNFFNNGNYEDNPNNQVPLETLHEQKDAKYLEAFDDRDLDITGGCAICAMNDYSTMTYPQIARFYGEKKGVIIQGKGVELVQPKNEIWYTSTDGEIVELYDNFGDGVTVVSNTYKDGKGVIVLSGDATLIGDSAFGACESLTSMAIPDSVAEIGEFAFAGCVSLTNVIIPDSVTSIGYGAFDECTGLISVTIPNSITSIGGFAFNNCEGLTSVTIGNCVASIGNDAFSACTSLYVTIPDSVESIGSDAFYNVPHIYYNGTATGSPWGALAIN